MSGISPERGKPPNDPFHHYSMTFSTTIPVCLQGKMLESYYILSSSLPCLEAASMQKPGILLYPFACFSNNRTVQKEVIWVMYLFSF